MKDKLLLLTILLLAVIAVEGAVLCFKPVPEIVVPHDPWEQYLTALKTYQIEDELCEDLMKASDPDVERINSQLKRLKLSTARLVAVEAAIR